MIPFCRQVIRVSALKLSRTKLEKMRAAALTAAAFMTALLSACHPAQHKRVVIDDWWNVDYAKIACNTPTSSQGSIGCIPGDLTSEVRAFEDQIVTYFASTKECHGISVVRYTGPKQPAPPNLDFERDWQLMIDYLPGYPTQTWVLLGEKHPSLMAKGTPRQIAERVCVALQGHGATVEN